MPRAEILFLISWAVGIAVISPLWIRASIRSRRAINEPLFPRPPNDAIFCERGASGHSLTQMGGARKSLMVAVTGAGIWITPTFPFNLIAPYGMLGMEHRIAKRDLISIETHKTVLGPSIILEFHGPASRRLMLDLRLKRSDLFLASIEALPD